MFQGVWNIGRLCTVRGRVAARNVLHARALRTQRDGADRPTMRGGGPHA